MDEKLLLNKDSKSLERKSRDKLQTSAEDVELEKESSIISQEIPLINNPISCNQTMADEGKKKRKLIESKPIKRKKLVSG